MSSFVIRDGDRFTVDVFCTHNNQASDNRIEYECTVVGAVTVTMKDMAEQLDAFLSPIYADLITTEATYRGVTVRPLDPFAGAKPRTQYSLGANVLAGTVAGKPLPGQAANILNLATPLAGLKNQGRLYLPFLGSDDLQADGVLTGGRLLNVATLGTFLTTGQLINGTFAGNITVSAGRYNGTDGFFYRFDRFWTSSSIATQKRRGDYGKSNFQPGH
jgi:hypothetical protein